MKNFIALPILLFSSLVFSQSETPRAVVSLIVDGNNLSHVKEVISEAKILSRKVPIRNLLLIQKMPDLSALSGDKNKISPEVQQKFQSQMIEMRASAQEVRALNLEQSEGKNDLSLLEKLRISYSPTWVVRHKGRNYIYEGYPSIERYFTNDGGFKEGD